MRKAEVKRKTKETEVRVVLRLDNQTGPSTVNTGIGFLDHMLESCARHGGFNLSVMATGDLNVDPHHTLEDVGIVLGQAVKKAVGDGKGIRRFAHAIVPMDEALATVALDYSGRGYLTFNARFGMQQIGGVPADLVSHFFSSCCTNAGITAHISVSGANDHHQCEAIFKAFGIALGQALDVREGRVDVPSTKGVF
jgi:imidazoleglycerol-phosphate dehydratase